MHSMNNDTEDTFLPWLMKNVHLENPFENDHVFQLERQPVLLR